MLAVPVSVVANYLAMLRKLLTTGVAANNDPCFDNVKKASSVIATNHLDKMTANNNDNAGNGCGNRLLCNGFSFFLSWCFSFFWKAGSNSMTADDDDNGGISHGNLLLLNGLSFCLFLVFFVFTGRQQFNDCCRQ